MTSPATLGGRYLRASIVTACACSVIISCGGSGGRIQLPSSTPPQAADQGTRPPLEGEWTLVALDTRGGRRQVSGFLRYDRFANLTVRAELAADEPTARAPQNVVAAFTAKASPSGGAFEFAGLREDVGRERLMPDAVDMSEWRYFEFAGPSLRLFVRDRAGRPTATLVFQRSQ